MTSLTGERADILESIRLHRDLFLRTVAGLDDQQARLTPTVSTLSLGGLIKHVAAIETEWTDFINNGPDDGPAIDWENVDWQNPPPEVVAREQQFLLAEDETLAGVIADYAAVAETTDNLVATVDLDAVQPLPVAPWFKPGSTRTARRTFLHLIAEISQHAGHADIIRESIDGAKTMG